MRGNRLVKRARTGAVLLVAVAVVATACRSELGAIPEGDYVVDVNDQGLVVGSRTLGSAVWTWDTGSGVRHDIAQAPGYYGRNVSAHDVNNAGVVAGSEWTPFPVDGRPRGRSKAVTWSPSGAMTTLDPDFAYSEAEALAINDHGVIAGWVTVLTGESEGQPTYDQWSVRWDPATGAVEKLTAFGTLKSEPTDVNNRGEVVGHNWFSKAYFWDPAAGTARQLEVEGAAYTHANAVNDRGDVVGGATFIVDGQQRHRAVRWDARTGAATLLPDLGAEESDAVDVNEAGVIVGHGRRADGVVHAFSLNPGASKAVDLGGDATTNSEAVSVNPIGQVYGVEDNRTLVRWFPETPRQN